MQRFTTVCLVVLLWSGTAEAQKICVSKVSVLEDAGITTLDAKTVLGTPENDANVETTTAEPAGPKIDFGDQASDGDLNIERGDSGTKSPMVQFGDQKLGESDLVDYGDQIKEVEGGPVFERKDRGTVDLGDLSEEDLNNAKFTDQSPKPTAQPQPDPFEALLGAAMGGDANLANGLKLEPTQGGFNFKFENLLLKVIQSPPPKSFEEAFAGLIRTQGEAHLRLDTQGKSPGKDCVPGTWDGKTLKLLTQSGNKLMMQFPNAKLVKDASKKARKVFKFSGPMQLGVEGK